ncbi:NB-ARC domain-containing protein [Murinocardiopsis flavida]|uniref:NB-ARC domain-containing protein n=1 Tax=Murinocardiopsis flavida TaxID=645275 RepID=A0A2P8D159_9ACTN|nr:tetratricopeptide repeat protein [Murinocardiopsis flavida]PSK90954.1 NB-ARC domain-containing protein [Murinocardiopsis flavida]
MSAICNSSYGPVSGTLVQIGTLNGSVDLGQPRRREVRLLPSVTSAFQDRTQEFGELDGWADEADVSGRRLWNVTGHSGVGKTTLALTWINENRHRFGHAQIAMECGGGAGGGRGRGIEEVCERYFALTGFVTEGRTLEGPAAKVDLFRSLIEERPAVVLLDDVQSAAQVWPFLTNLPGLLVIVTSRVPITGLAQERPRRLDLSPMMDEAAADLFVEILGAERTAAESGAFAELVRVCQGLPLIVSHAAGVLYDRPDLMIGELVARMADRGRLAALEDGNEDTMTRPSTVFDVSYGELGSAAAEVYRAIGLHPTRDFGAGLIAALFPASTAHSEAGLRELLHRGLVKEDRRGRYLMEDLTYEHAALLAQRTTGPGERARLRERIADFYLYGAIAADKQITQRWRLSPLYAERPPLVPPVFADAPRGTSSREWRRGEPPTPMEWFGDNLDAIMACMERSARIWADGSPAPGYGWQMAEATNGYFTANGRDDERATILSWAEQDAEACGDPDAQARIQAQWAEMMLGRGRLDDAQERFRRSLEAAQAGTEWRGVGGALEGLGITERRRGRAGEALDFFDRSEPFLDPERPRSQALHRMHRADAHVVNGDSAAALESYAAALVYFREHARVKRDHANEGKVLLRQAELMSQAQPRQARALAAEALSLFRTSQRPYQEGKALEALGDLGGHDDAEASPLGHWRAALEIYTRIGNTEAAERIGAKLRAAGAVEDG